MIVQFSAVQKPEPDTTDLDGWVVVAGIWQATVGTYHATYSAYEFVHMISGKITIIPDDGTPPTIVKSGDSFIVESNFKGLWRIEEDVTKHFSFML